METIFLNQSQWLAISQMILKLKEQQLLQELGDSGEIEDLEVKERALIKLREDLENLYNKNGSLVLSGNALKDLPSV